MALASCIAGIAGVALGPATASAHVLMTSPTPRNDRDDLKPPAHPAPCGGVARTNTFIGYQAGATIAVTFKETVSHAGCFQIAFSRSNDSNFEVLAQMVDPAGGAGQSYTMNVKLPDGVTCEACTLQLRQQMSGTPQCPANPAEPPIAATYYSCADVRVGDFPDASPPVDEANDGGTGGTASSSGAGAVAPDPGSNTDTTDASTSTSRKLRPIEPSAGGCSVAVGAVSGVPLVACAMIGLLWHARRRRSCARSSVRR